jgi:hypothetical protein
LTAIVLALHTGYVGDGVSELIDELGFDPVTTGSHERPMTKSQADAAVAGAE